MKDLAPNGFYACDTMPTIMATTKRKHIKVGDADRVIVKAGKNSNKMKVEITLTRKQEKNLLKMLRERN